MIGVRHRFHGHNSLRGVYERGQSLRAQFITLKFSRRDPRRPYRVAIVVSRKVSKSAVTRNRIRRRLYEIVRREGGEIAPGTDLVFTVYDEKVATMPAGKLEDAVKSLLQKTARPKSGPQPGS